MTWFQAMQVRMGAIFAGSVPARFGDNAKAGQVARSPGQFLHRNPVSVRKSYPLLGNDRVLVVFLEL
jgi:hypothetical protein